LQQLSSKKSLLPASDDLSDSDAEDIQSIWLNLTTKQHIVDRNRLKPSKIAVPHSLHDSSSLSVCIISADPQRAVKNAVADPSFPSTLSSRITKIIGYSKLKARYHSFESRRELLSEHDVFLADDRIITRLPDTLGKVFYKGTAKRPIPIQIAQENRIEGKRFKTPKQKVPNEEKHASIASPAIVAKEIEKALKSVPVSLKPGTSLSVRVGNTKLTPQQLADNVSVVARGIIERHVVKGWRNVKSIHVKSPNSAALPIWLADDMWVEDEGVADGLEAGEHESALTKKSKRGKRRSESESDVQGHARKRMKAPTDPVNGEDRLLAAARRAKLSQQKARAMQEGALVSLSS
jgi:ribosome biogenesis protein UTP30